MFDVLFKFNFFVQCIRVAVHYHADKTLLFQLFKQFGELALSTPYDRRKYLQFCTDGIGGNTVANLVDTGLFDFMSAMRAVRRADPCKKQTQIVVDFRHCAHRRARVGTGCFLVDGNRRAQSFDTFDVGLFHQPQKLPCVTAEAFHVPALSLGKNRVEGKR